MKKTLIYLFVVCFSLSWLVFGFHYHEEGEIDDYTCHICLSESPQEGQTVLKATGYDDANQLGSYTSPFPGFIPQDGPHITTPTNTVLLISLRDKSVPSSLSPHPFSNRAPPAL